jgi:type I restriction enzyme S subunit
LASGRFWVNNHAHIVTGNELADTRYLLYALLNTDISSYLTGAVMPKLTQGNLNRIMLPCPPRPVQAQLVAVLRALDDRIALLRETNSTLEAIAQALFKSWFVDFDPVRAKQQGLAPTGMDEATATLFPDSFKELDLGERPSSWEFQAVGDAVECVGGATPDTKEDRYWNPGEHAWTTPKDLSGLPSPVLLGTERCVSAAGLARIGSGLLPAGTLLLSSRAPIGYLAVCSTAGGDQPRLHRDASWGPTAASVHAVLVPPEHGRHQGPRERLDVHGDQQEGVSADSGARTAEACGRRLCERGHAAV